MALAMRSNSSKGRFPLLDPKLWIIVTNTSKLSRHLEVMVVESCVRFFGK